MSSVITLSTGAEETIHGTFAAAKLYVDMMFGESADTWRDLAASGSLTADDRKMQTLAAAVRFLNAQTWGADAETFVLRDAIAAFATAQYELAVLIANDASVIANADQGSNIASLGAGSARISFFNPSTKNAPKLPPSVQRLVGSYLAASTLGGPDGGESLSSCSDNPFSACEDLDRGEPY